MKPSSPKSRQAGSFGLIALACIAVCMVSACGGGGRGDDASGESGARHALAAANDNRLITYIDTGISASQCYQAGSDILVSCTSSAALALHDWQDGMVGRDVTSADSSDGKLGFNYSMVGSYAKTECVQDNVTGLLWEGKPSSGPRASTDTYTNLENNGSGDASGYVRTVNAAGLCGYNDWRLPNRHELQSLVYYGRSNVLGVPATIDEDWFPNTQGLGRYLSSSSYAGKSTQAWSVNFGNGDVGKHDERSSAAYVRLVRGNVKPPSQFSYSANGTEVTDNQTKLIWSRCSLGQSWSGTNCIDSPTLVNQEQALSSAKLVKGWRIPNIKELSSLVDSRRESPAIDTAAFPSTPLGCVWSSSPVVGGATAGAKVWTVDISYGSVDAVWDRRGGTPCFVRLVRSAP